MIFKLSLTSLMPWSNNADQRSWSCIRLRMLKVSVVLKIPIKAPSERSNWFYSVWFAIQQTTWFFTTPFWLFMKDWFQKADSMLPTAPSYCLHVSLASHSIILQQRICGLLCWKCKIKSVERLKIVFKVMCFRRRKATSPHIFRPSD